MGADADGAADFRRFPQLPNVSKCRLWKKEFGAYPPRGVASRIARRAGLQVDSPMAFRGRASPKQFKAEVRRNAGWFKPGRRSTRRRRGIIQRPWA
eukprot:602092-Pyramimonas_sp.AAC.1